MRDEGTAVTILDEWMDHVLLSSKIYKYDISYHYYGSILDIFSAYSSPYESIKLFIRICSDYWWGKFGYYFGYWWETLKFFLALKDYFWCFSVE